MASVTSIAQRLRRNLLNSYISYVVSITYKCSTRSSINLKIFNVNPVADVVARSLAVLSDPGKMNLYRAGCRPYICALLSRATIIDHHTGLVRIRVSLDMPILFIGCISPLKRSVAESLQIFLFTPWTPFGMQFENCTRNLASKRSGQPNFCALRRLASESCTGVAQAYRRI